MGIERIAYMRNQPYFPGSLGLDPSGITEAILEYRKGAHHGVNVFNETLIIPYSKIAPYGQYVDQHLPQALLAYIVDNHSHYNIPRDIRINTWINIEGVNSNEHLISCHRTPGYVNAIFETQLIWNHVPIGDLFIVTAGHNYF